jgi:hypothetical protein
MGNGGVPEVLRQSLDFTTSRCVQYVDLAALDG